MGERKVGWTLSSDPSRYRRDEVSYSLSVDVQQKSDFFFVIVLNRFFYSNSLISSVATAWSAPISAEEYANTTWAFKRTKKEGVHVFPFSVIHLIPKCLPVQEFMAPTYISLVCTKDKVSAFPSNCLAFNQCHHKCDIWMLNPNILLVQINMICKKSQINNPLHTNGL